MYASRDSDEEEPHKFVDEDPVNNNGVPFFWKSSDDTLINAEVLLPRGEKLQKAQVKKHQVGLDGNDIGTYDPNPMLKSLIYEMEYPDGSICEYVVNVMAEIVYSQVDKHGYRQQTLYSIMERSKDSSDNTKYLCEMLMCNMWCVMCDV